MPVVSDPGPPAPDLARLNGWKEIASHLGKGVRTAQRWERQYGLPVHRIGEPGGEIVYAYRHEVDAWVLVSARARAGDRPVAGSDEGAEEEVLQERRSRAQEVTPRADRRPRGFLGVAGWLLAALAAGLAYLAWDRDRGPSPSTAVSRTPATWKVVGGVLHVFDEAGREMWSHPLEGSAKDENYGQLGWPTWSTPIAVVDLDGDGPREVVFRVMAAAREHNSTLRCLNADGTLRWERRLDDTVRFGPDTYYAPWLVLHFAVLPNGDGTHAVWAVFVHAYLFPSVLEQIDRHGDVRSRYWSNGYVNSLNQATWKGRPVLLVGAANNEHRSASLAVLDAANPTATAPAVNPAYRCTTCPAREPEAFVVFPRSPVTRARGEPNGVVRARITAGDAMVAETADHHVLGLAASFGVITHTLDARLRPVTAAISKAYLDVHDAYVAIGRIDHPYAPERDSRLGPVLKWEGGRFVETGVAEVR